MNQSHSPTNRSRAKSSKPRRKAESNKQLSHRSRSTQGHATGVHPASGILELHPQGFGFLRQAGKGCEPRQDDPYVPASMIQRFQLRQGMHVVGSQRLANEAAMRDRAEAAGGRVTSLTDIDGFDPLSCLGQVRFEELMARNPTRWLRLEHPEQPVSMRVLDLLCPLGLGQRALIAAPPRAGKTTLLKQIARSLSLNHPDLHLVALLVDERPEEVTEMEEELCGEIFASSLDQKIECHTRLSKLVIERCQRLAERGKDVVLVVDSLTRMSRAFNKLTHPSGPMGPGGLSIRAMEIPRQLFASARDLSDEGSLTIIATALIGTDNRMDEAIFREFKGTGNLDLVLSQDLADRGIWPALDVKQSATRRAELLHDVQTSMAMRSLRNTLLTMPPVDAIGQLTEKLSCCQTNVRFVDLINGSTAEPKRK